MVVYLHGYAQNYNEQLVPLYTLPPLLVTNGGKKINNQTDWIIVRRPEIIKLFEDNVYGQMPKDFDSIRFTPLHAEQKAMNDKAILHQVNIQAFRQGKSVVIHLVMFIPANQHKPVPLFLFINNRSKQNTDASRTVKTEFWPAEEVINKGYAIAAFHISDLAPDNKQTFSNGVLQLYPEQLMANNGMRAIGAWAWGACRVMDYLQTNKHIDRQKIAIVGHSRGGKAALWTSAVDTRFALCFASCSGNTGAAIARRRYGETIAKINQTFPYWFCENYKKFNGKEDDLPVDQHMLIALSAPRGVYTTNATEDLWADPTGSYLALKKAEPVYKLTHHQSRLPVNAPPPNKPVLLPPLGYHLRTGEHDLTLYDWNNFILFANRYFNIYELSR